MRPNLLRSKAIVEKGKSSRIASRPVVVCGDAAGSLSADLRQILADLGLTDRVRLEEGQEFGSPGKGTKAEARSGVVMLAEARRIAAGGWSC